MLTLILLHLAWGLLRLLHRLALSCYLPGLPLHYLILRFHTYARRGLRLLAPAVLRIQLISAVFSFYI